MAFFKKHSNTELPTYWLNYVSRFPEQKEHPIPDQFVVLDTETTGFDITKDRIVSIGCVTVKQNEIKVSASLELYIKQDLVNGKAIEIHGILNNRDMSMLSEDQAIEIFLDYIGSSVIVMHHAEFDLGMLNQVLLRRGMPKLKNPYLDTNQLYRATRIKSNLIDMNKKYKLDEIADNMDIDLRDRHTAVGDALITAIILMKCMAELNKRHLLSLKELQNL
jgi:DNA polymerase III subunit epsilon